MKTWKKLTWVVLLMLVVGAVASAQTNKVRTVTSLPGTCKAGSATQLADLVNYGGILYICSATNVWSTVPYPAAGTSVTMNVPGYYKCSGACNVTLATIPGNQYCVRNDNNVSSAITLVNVSGVQFEATAHTSYYSANRKLVSGGAVTDQICIVVASDAAHFDVWSAAGTWTDTAP